ncbi:hypothetical protein [Luteimonas notoginsengisoli]|uniref:hypothetical protein n=1 Tax=Luteimonas notoginsengisoli TaxID=1578200 RepID=UPI0036DE4831
MTGGTVIELGPNVSSEQVGLKALGLLRMPTAWVPPFFVVSGTTVASQEAIYEAAHRLELPDEVWVRSSGMSEGMSERGALESQVARLSTVSATIAELKATAAFQAERDSQIIHFVVQSRVSAKKKGHLSNERHLQRHARDWTYQIEDGAPQSVAVRKWRDASLRDTQALASEALVHIPRPLRAMAAWIGQSRAHLEWVWDGEHVWVVQLDLLRDRDTGVDPRSLVSRKPRPEISRERLRAFTPSTLKEMKGYPKLNNARMYAKLGYKMPKFYVLVSSDLIDEVLHGGRIPSDLLCDLELLCAHPFVLRTDAEGLKPSQRQMLPRSDELRTASAACDWLLGKFRQTMSTLSSAKKVALIGHHFIPAVASAWCQATPDDRRARIESLWGIPEGLYCYAHDVFDVDTMHARLAGKNFNSSQILLRRERYKGKFVAPNSHGEWRVHHTSVGPDWTRSIERDAWVKEIAWRSREIAIEAGEPVVVMWFINIPNEQSLQRVMPWYHEPWKPTPGGYKKAAPRTKLNSAQIRRVSNQQDWHALVQDAAKGAVIERVVVDPQDESIIRSREFVNALATHAKNNDYVVELSGGLLSHFYYMLAKEGCHVECVDLFGVTEEAIEYNKLVRDKVPDDIVHRGELVQVYALQGDALVASLRRKVVEESFEVLEAATIDDIADEIADLAEVTEALMSALKIDMKEIEGRRAKKTEKRGAFEKGLMLARTSLPPPLRSDINALTSSGEQIKTLKDVIDLPRFDSDFHVDQRLDSSGIPERQLTLTLSTFDEHHSFGGHIFDLVTASGAAHKILFRATVERLGATLKLKVRLTSAADQMELPLDTQDA